jgi:hypothetical protein
LSIADAAATPGFRPASFFAMPSFLQLIFGFRHAVTLLPPELPMIRLFSFRFFADVAEPPAAFSFFSGFGLRYSSPSSVLLPRD